MKRIIATVQLVFLAHALAYAVADARIAVSFYSETVELRYNDAMLKPSCTGINESGIASYYRQLERTPYQPLLNDLLAAKHALALNDWLLYQLLHEGLETIMKEKSAAERELAAWFFLSKMTFKTRVAYLDEQVFLYVLSEDEVFEIPMIEDRGERFVNLTNSLAGATPALAALYLLNFDPTPDGNAFGFYLTALPKLRTDTATATVHFPYLDSVFQLNVQYDRTLVDVMEHYPLIAERKYLELPFSKILEASLLPSFRRMTAGKTKRQALELLLAFTRSGFEYKEDKVFFGRSKPMIPDEVFFYPYSDCEDRAALFFGMVKALLDLPMIVVAFPNHLTVAVQLNEDLPGAVIQYEGKGYYICDPTGPVNSSEIGVFPIAYQNEEFEIVTTYK